MFPPNSNKLTDIWGLEDLRFDKHLKKYTKYLDIQSDEEDVGGDQSTQILKDERERDLENHINKIYPKKLHQNFTETIGGTPMN